MLAKHTASTRRHALRSVCVASMALLGLLLMFPPAAFGTEPVGDSEASEETPRARRDFRFSQSRVAFGLRGGWAFNRTESDIYDDLTSWLTLEKSDFDAPAFTVDVSWRLLSRLDAVIGFEYSSRSTRSEDRDYVDEFGIPIVQDTRLTQVPLTFSLKFYPTGRGRQVGQHAWVPAAVAPYLGGGIGATWYRLKQSGDFVFKPFCEDPPCEDPPILPIFEDVFTSKDWAFAGHVFLGVDIKLIKNLGLVFEGRYYWADADVRGDFDGFDPIDLNGARVMAGINWKL